jgi:hypothetical protein
LLVDGRIRIRNPYIYITNPDADPGGPKTYGSGTLDFIETISNIEID